MAIQWGLAGPGYDALETLQVAGQAAQQRMQQQRMQEEAAARQQAAQTRARAAGQLQGGDYAGATNTAIGAGDFDLAKQISGMREDERKATAAQFDTIGRVAFGLRNVPMEQRAQRLQAVAPQLLAMGIAEEELAGLDLSDAAIDGYIATSQTIAQRLAADLTQTRIEDVGYDNQRSDRLADNTVQSTAERLRLARNADARGAASNARAAEARREGRVRFSERDKDRAALAAGGRFIPTFTDDLDY